MVGIETGPHCLLDRSNRACKIFDCEELQRELVDFRSQQVIGPGDPDQLLELLFEPDLLLPKHRDLPLDQRDGTSGPDSCGSWSEPSRRALRSKKSGLPARYSQTASSDIESSTYSGFGCVLIGRSIPH